MTRAALRKDLANLKENSVKSERKVLGDDQVQWIRMESFPTDQFLNKKKKEKIE